MGEVHPHQFGGQFGVPGLDGIDDLDVLLAGAGQFPLVRELLQALHTGLVAEPADRRDQPAVAQQLQQPHVELPVEVGEGGQIPFLEESGEIIDALRAGALTRADLTELGTALASAPGDRGKRTVFKTVGVAMQDWAIAQLLADKFLC